MVEGNVIYFKNLTLVTERVLCFMLRKAKNVAMKIRMLFILGFF